MEIKENQVIEALLRMKKLNIDERIIFDFKEKRNLCCSLEGISFLELDEYIKEKIEILEKDKGILVYHIIISNKGYGVCYNFLYVSKDKEYWEEEKRYLEHGYVYAYVMNMEYPNNSDCGTIEVISHNGILERR